MPPPSFTIRTTTSTSSISRQQRGKLRTIVPASLVFAVLSVFTIANFGFIFHLSAYYDVSTRGRTSLHGGGVLPPPPPPPPQQQQQDVVVSRSSRIKSWEVQHGNKKNKNSYKLGDLSCDAWGGPAPDVAQEMVYWKDIPSDTRRVSPLKRITGPRQFLTFEPDEGGFNNLRMAFETMLALAVAMGRTLVLPPELDVYMMGNASLQQFFRIKAIQSEHAEVQFLTMQEFLEQEVMTGNLQPLQNNKQDSFPPGNRTDWNGEPVPLNKANELNAWLRRRFHNVMWNPDECLAAFPETTQDASIADLLRINHTVMTTRPPPTYQSFVGKPTPVNATALERLQENLAGRQNLCIYDKVLQSHTVLHFPVSEETRMLVHFYAMLFFQDWKQDLWMKRFVRDHVRFADEIQCAAARVVERIRQGVRERTGDATGSFDTVHIRRGDFPFQATQLTANDIYLQLSKILPENATVFIATDERDKSFFDPLRAHYDVLFLDDFHEALGTQLNRRFLGIVDMLVASRGRYFMGCWFSTFTGYINRLRGYHAVQDGYPGADEQGIIPSWYYAPASNFDQMQSFYPVKQNFYAREFPNAWRNIDFGLE